MTAGRNQAAAEVLLTSGQAARRLRVVAQTVVRWADLGYLECTRTLGGHRRFKESVVQALRDRLYGPETVMRPRRANAEAAEIESDPSAKES